MITGRWLRSGYNKPVLLHNGGRLVSKSQTNYFHCNLTRKTLLALRGVGEHAGLQEGRMDATAASFFVQEAMLSGTSLGFPPCQEPWAWSFHAQGPAGEVGLTRSQVAQLSAIRPYDISFGWRVRGRGGIQPLRECLQWGSQAGAGSRGWPSSMPVTVVDISVYFLI